MKLWLVRHGETEANVAGLYSGHTPTPLTAKGQRQAQRLMAKYGDGADLSRMDWMIAQDMAKGGRFTVQDIEKGIRECSPNVESRKAGHTEDYARRSGIPFRVIEPKERSAKRLSYSDNFRYARAETWTH